LAPDLFVCLRLADFVFDSWKTWEHGAPDLAVEIVSATDAGWGEWDRKLDRYQEAGIQEIVRFAPASPERRRLRVWDCVEGDIVERSTEGDRTPCATLGLHWVVKDDAKLGAMLRLARDEAGLDLLPTLEEAHERLQHELRKLRGGG
jgi:Uma2 family endonuclease